MSVSALVISPLTHGLFQRAILQSGATNSFIGSESKEKAWNKLRFVAGFLNCNQATNISDIVTCIEAKSTSEIQNAVNTAGRLGQFFEPSYGTEMLPRNPVDILKSGTFNQKLDLLWGVNSDEGASGVYGVFNAIRPDSGKHLTIDMVKDFIEEMVTVFGVQIASKEIADWYSKGLNESDQVSLRNAVANVYGDFNLVCPCNLFGQQYAKMAPSQKYYAYRLVQPVLHGSGNCEQWMGVCHSMDLDFVFGHPIAENATHRFSEKDYRLSKDIIKAWTNFAKHGNPGKMGNVQWEEAFDVTHGNHGLESLNLMWLDADAYQMKRGFFHQLCDGFWRAKIF